MSDERAFSGRPRPVPTVLDTLRARIDPDSFDGVVLSLEAVAADLGYGDVRPLPGSIAWVDVVRGSGKRVGVTFGGDSAASALQLAGVDDRFDAIVHGPRTVATLADIAAELDTTVERSAVVDASPDGITAAREAGAAVVIALARGSASPETLRRAGADAVVADLQELLAPFES